MTSFKATYCYAEDEGSSLTAGLADCRDNTHHYVLFQRAKISSVEDQALGFDQPHIEINDQRWSGYGSVDKIRVENEKLTVVFNDRGRAVFAVKNYEVVLGEGVLTGQFSEIMNEMFGDRYEVIRVG
ncbi:MAG TPA: Imm10 family immunity protein [Prosthecobacter sp.]